MCSAMLLYTLNSVADSFGSCSFAVSGTAGVATEGTVSAMVE